MLDPTGTAVVTGATPAPMTPLRESEAALEREVNVTRSRNLLFAAMTRLCVRRHHHVAEAAPVLVLAMVFALGGYASAAADEIEARAIFTKFVAAQNAHNADDVKALLWNSPNMLWFSRGVETRGRDAVVARFKEYYQGTWHLEPDMTQFRAAAISSDVMQILVPIVFTRGLPGKPPQDNTFLISQTLVSDGSGWYVASILPIANTQLK